MYYIIFKRNKLLDLKFTTPFSTGTSRITTDKSESTYISRVQSCVCVFQNIDPPPPLHPASVSSSRTKGGGYTLPGGKGVGGQYFGRRQP